MIFNKAPIVHTQQLQIKFECHDCECIPFLQSLTKNLFQGQYVKKLFDMLDNKKISPQLQIHIFQFFQLLPTYSVIEKFSSSKLKYLYKKLLKKSSIYQLQYFLQFVLSKSDDLTQNLNDFFKLILSDFIDGKIPSECIPLALELLILPDNCYLSSSMKQSHVESFVEYFLKIKFDDIQTLDVYFRCLLCLQQNKNSYLKQFIFKYIHHFVSHTNISYIF
jgi:hypothetical protein